MINDLSEKNIKKNVVNTIVQHPITIMPLAIGLIGLYALFLDLISGSVIFGIILGACGFGLVSLVINFIRKGSFENRYINSLNSKMEKEKVAKISRLRSKLKILRDNKELSIYADQAQVQFDKIKDKFDRFKDMLSEKFNSSELTFGRFLGTSEQVYLAVLDNLEKIVHSLESMNSIDLAYVEERLTHLNSLSNPEEADKAEIETMNKRKTLHEKQRESVNKLLTYNEEAMTEIDLSMSSIASAETNPDRASVDIEFARSELVRLAERTKNFKN